MISTVTLNASIDKAYQLACPLVDGTVMRVETCIDNAGGKGLNAARAVATCGEKVVATGFVGGNNGRLLCELLDADGIEHDFVHVEAETRCCVNVLEPDGRSTEFLEPGRPVGSEEVAAVRAKIAQIAESIDIPGAEVTSYAWRPLVGLLSATDPSGRTVSYERNASGKLRRVLDPLARPTAAWLYSPDDRLRQ